MYNTKVFAKNEKERETLMQKIRIYSQDIGMEFDIEKCTLLIKKSGKRATAEGINQKSIRTLGEK